MMAANEDPVVLLKGRLARGEISIEEYSRNLPHLLGPAQGTAPRNVVESERIKRIITGKAQHDTVDDSSPISVDGLVVGASFIQSGRQRVSTTDVVSLRFKSVKQTVNLISSSKTWLWITVRSGEIFKHNAWSAIVSGDANQKLTLAFRALAERTFSQRLQHRRAQIETTGKTRLNDVDLSSDGYIIKSGKRINIADAWKIGHVKMGTAWSFGYGFLNKATASNPYEWVVGENGTGLLSRRIVIEACDDTDVMRALLESWRPRS